MKGGLLFCATHRTLLLWLSQPAITLASVDRRDTMPATTLASVDRRDTMQATTLASVDRRDTMPVA